METQITKWTGATYGVNTRQDSLKQFPAENFENLFSCVLSRAGEA